MKQTLFAWLVSLLSRPFKQNKKVDERPAPYSVDEGRPIEQIINEGSQGVVETVPTGGCYAVDQTPVWMSDANKVIKSQAEQDYEHLKAKLHPKDIVCIPGERYDGLIKLAFVNEEVDKWINNLSDTYHIFVIPEVKNIGIVKC